MPRSCDHELGEVRTYTLLRNVCGRSSASALGHGLSRPCTHDDGRACPSTLPNRAPVGCAPGPSRPGPGLRRAFPLRDLPRQGFRARHHGQRFPAGPGRRFAASARRPG
jgi:hypothetical protein